jgi:hypothetical protein
VVLERQQRIEFGVIARDRAARHRVVEERQAIDASQDSVVGDRLQGGCDIRGVGKALDSNPEGAHLIAEIRKAYPVKYLVSYSGAQFDMSCNGSLSKVDVSVAKDAQTDQWVSVLESGLVQVGNPGERWLRFRTTLLDRGVDLHEVFELEPTFIKSIEKRDAVLMKRQTERTTP